MPSRQSSRKPFPQVWLMTDPRLGEGLLAAIQRLPARSGVVFRHYELAAKERRRLFAEVRRICARRGHLLLLASSSGVARKWGADGVHGRFAITGLRPHSASVHTIAEIRTAKRFGADLLFLSPLRTTRSHDGIRPLGATRFHQLARLCRPAKVIALGGMTRAHAAKWPRDIVHGWAAIDAFIS